MQSCCLVDVVSSLEDPPRELAGLSSSRKRLERRHRLWSHRLLVIRKVLLQHACPVRPPVLPNEKVKYTVVPLAAASVAEQADQLHVSHSQDAAQLLQADAVLDAPGVSEKAHVAAADDNSHVGAIAAWNVGNEDFGMEPAEAAEA